MRSAKIVLPVLSGVLLYLLWSHRQDSAALVHTLGHGDARALLLAGVFQGAVLFNQPAFFKALFGLVGLETEFGELMWPVWAGKFVNVVAPAGGLGETALLFQQAKSKGWSVGQVSLVTALFFGFNFAVFAVLLVVGMGVLFGHGDLKPAMIWASAPIFVGVGVGALVLAFLSKRPERLLRWAEVLEKRPLGRRMPAGRIRSGAEEMAAAFGALKSGRKFLGRASLHAALVDGLALGVLGACLAAYGVSVSPVNLLAAYAVGTLFSIVSISPQGLGFVEGSMTAALVSLGVPLDKAGAVVLAYRGFSFWLPLLTGFWAARQVAKRHLTTQEDREAVPGSFSKKLPKFLKGRGSYCA